MSKLVTRGNIAAFEYQAGVDKDDLFIEIDKKGTLWVHGYKIPFVPGGKPIRALKRYDTGLKDYTVIGDYDYFSKVVVGDLSEIINGLDITRTVFLMKTNTIEI